MWRARDEACGDAPSGRPGRPPPSRRRRLK
uniref:Uncharacterized protein n=1 Tax=Siphoviridae sp. ctvWR21 TaxID=2827966 RepID=A0A8S5TM68_9CAUD|nr:MAG TPA: hypothetical protein [Siphoviridae sp. ctvWR21]